MKRIAGAVMALTMVLSLLPLQAYAEGPVLVRGEIGNYIVLSDNWDLNEGVIIEDGKSHTINLNGYSIVSEGGITVRNGTNLTITDNRGGGRLTFLNGTCLKVCGYEGEVEGYFIDGTVDYRRVTAVNSSIEINGGEIISEGLSTIEVKGCGASLSIRGGEVLNNAADNSESVAVRTFSEKSEGGVSIEVSGGKITSKGGTALLLAAGGTYNIEGSGTVIEGRRGIEVLSGTLNVGESPEVKGVGEGEGTEALAVISGDSEEYYGEIEVIIRGGLFKSKNSPAVREYSVSSENNRSRSVLNLFKISGGSFEGADVDIQSENRRHFISGGTFVHDPSLMMTENSLCTVCSENYFQYSVSDSNGEKDGEVKDENGDNSGSEEDINVPFQDVNEKDFFYDSVIWAYSKGVTSGRSENLFCPNGTCTRAEAVTFLWRLAGEPTLGKNSFADVKPSSYYYKAVAWAEYSGIAYGIRTDHFCPDERVTRGQFLTFLMRYAINVDGRINNYVDTITFKDVKKGDFYYGPVIWAYSVGISTGRTSESFAPDDKCTRAETVTFLKRYFG